MGLAGQLLLRAYTCIFQKISIQVCTKGNRVGRSIAAAPRDHFKGYKGLAGQVRLGAYACVFRNLSIQSCTQVRHGSKVTKAWPTSCCCEQTPVCCRICQFRAAPNIQGLQGFRRTKCCCEHTHVYCRNHTCT